MISPCTADNQKTMHALKMSAAVPGRGIWIVFCLLAVCIPHLNAESASVATPGTVEITRTVSRKPFPSLYFTDNYADYLAREGARPYWVSTEAELEYLARLAEDRKSILLNQDILAFYGHPLSKRMGILGVYPIEELDKRLTALADEYREHNNGRGIKKAFYIIYGTVWPEGEIGILRDSVLLSYIEYALEHDILVFIDHQIGKYDVIDSLRRMLPYLRFPNVHLALDPEWRTQKPMEEIGSVTAAEVNEAQRVMEEYLIEHNLPGERMLVIHQFNWRMILNREQVRSNFDRVRIVHCADGFGSPDLKRHSYAYNARAANMPIKGFKLFYNSGIPGAGFDDPILSPREVLRLDPKPYIIMYQ
ncbi:hypothetical protein [Breznakiella homolactica]|uniref:Uncharacterized protein n=1 Tax=Breznakiella homolactica TaxID=2798577 RepID=A0A7T7XNC6_9SPIR|nr:hypothetical protein [Breznakiella homolactica]QQO09417.1 hypothetical protein JFL75_00395 [Breznakiella homolactica]